MRTDDEPINPLAEQSPGTHPKVRPSDVEASIKSEHYFTAQEGVLGMLAADGVPPSIYEKANAAPKSLALLTICVLELQNGFTVLGTSACASPENFDFAYGRKLARGKAVDQVWPLLGYELRTQLSRPVLTDADAAADLAGTIRPDNPSAEVLAKLQPHEQRVCAERVDLENRLNKLQGFFGSVSFAQLSDIEQQLLSEQSHLMARLSAVLAKRIALFTPADTGVVDGSNRTTSGAIGQP